MAGFVADFVADVENERLAASGDIIAREEFVENLLFIGMICPWFAKLFVFCPIGRARRRMRYGENEAADVAGDRCFDLLSLKMYNAT